MYISKICIKNFRNFGDSPFEMELRPFTLILGENNIGKTNLLAALSLLFNQEISVGQNRALQLDDINYETVAAFKREVIDDSIPVDEVAFPEVVIEATLTDINDDQHAVVGDWYSKPDLSEAQVTYRFAVRGNLNREKWVKDRREAINAQHSAGEDDDNGEGSDEIVDDIVFVDFPIGEYRHTIYGGGRPSNECEAWLLRMLQVELLGALRDAERELIAGGDQRLLFRVLRQGGDSGFVDVKRLLDDLKTAIDTDSSLATIRNDVCKLLSRVSLATSGEDHSIGLHFAAPETLDILKKIGMTYGANPITVARNGLGRNNLLYMALVLSHLAKPSDVAAGDESYVCFRLVGIEEPEAHLHPHLQDHLARNIEDVRKEDEDTLQLILTSHSTHVPAKLSLANTAILFRRDTDSTIDAHYVLDSIDPAKDKDAVRFLSLYLDATKSRMFFARRLILVEGIAEQIVVPMLFEQTTGHTLESIGGTVVNVNGVAFRHFLTIVENGFFKRCVVLTDSDIGTKSENRANNLKADFKGASHIDVQATTESTFEKDLIAANKAGDGKALLFAALTMTKPGNGPKLQSRTGTKDIDVEEFFSEIKDYKAEFAFSVVSVLAAEPALAEKEKRVPRTLAIPGYISAAFAFLQG
jgi:predicted ATP-dependent endonuclease of OLD family